MNTTRERCCPEMIGCYCIFLVSPTPRTSSHLVSSESGLWREKTIKSCARSRRTTSSFSCNLIVSPSCFFFFQHWKRIVHWYVLTGLSSSALLVLTWVLRLFFVLLSCYLDVTLTLPSDTTKTPLVFRDGYTCNVMSASSSYSSSRRSPSLEIHRLQSLFSWKRLQHPSLSPWYLFLAFLV